MSARAWLVFGFVALGLAAAMGGCDGGAPARERCARCGMYIDLSPRWTAGLKSSAGREEHFDAPKCMLRYRADQPGAREAWVTEYYSQTRMALDQVRLVEGSDVLGPMGRDLVPVEASAAEGFARDHGGRVLRVDEVDAAVLASLDR